MNLTASLSEFDGYLARRGYKITRQRQAIARLFLVSQGHISAEELYRKISKQDSTVSLSTVYRTLRLLSDANLASERQFGGGRSRYEPAAAKSHHDHIICTSCGTIIEFENPSIERLQERIAEEHKFEVASHKLELYGLCRKCRGKAGS